MWAGVSTTAAVELWPAVLAWSPVGISASSASSCSADLSWASSSAAARRGPLRHGGFLGVVSPHLSAACRHPGRAVGLMAAAAFAGRYRDGATHRRPAPAAGPSWPAARLGRGRLRPGWNPSSWSISAEWFAYLSFPAFAVVALPARPAAAGEGSWPSA